MDKSRKSVEGHSFAESASASAMAPSLLKPHSNNLSDRSVSLEDCLTALNISFKPSLPMLVKDKSIPNSAGHLSLVIKEHKEAAPLASILLWLSSKWTLFF